MITTKREERTGDLLTKEYGELCKLAAAQIARGHRPTTLQPAALVHEAWLRLGGTEQSGWHYRAHFFAAAAQAMRHILIDRTRRRRAVRHGGDQIRLNIEDVDIEAQAQDDERLFVLNEAIERLAAAHPRMAKLWSCVASPAAISIKRHTRSIFREPLRIAGGCSRADGYIASCNPEAELCFSASSTYVARGVLKQALPGSSACVPPWRRRRE